LGALAALRKAAGSEGNLMPYLIDAVKAYCTVGEITSELKEVWGVYEPSTVF
jgi:methylmalonyl-CoA mutase N-terminal domain/subunit